MATFGFQSGFQAPTYGQEKIVGGSGNNASIMPTQQMQSYNIQGKILPGVSDDKAQKIVEYVKSTAKTPEEEKLMLSDLHQEAIKFEQKEAYKKERDNMKAQMMQEQVKTKDKSQKKSIDLSLKIANFSDIIREGAMKEGIDLSDMNDEELIGKHIQANPNQQQLFVDYINGKKTSVDVGKDLGIIKTEDIVENDEKDDKTEKDILSDVGLAIGGGAAALGSSYVGGGILKNIGKKIYGLTLPPGQSEAEAIQAYKAGITNFKPKTVVETAIEQPILTKGGRTISSKLGEIGTRSMIGEQSAAQANNIFKNIINPIFEKSDELGMSFDYKEMIEKAKTNIIDSKKRSENQKKIILEHIDDIAQDYQGSTTLRNLDLEKQAIVSKIPSKQMNLLKPTNEAKAAAKELSNTFRKTVHNTIKEIFGIDSAKLYGDYANLKELSKIGPKALTEAGRKGGAGNFISRVADELGTPITTVIGKITYKAGELSQKLPSTILKIIKSSPKILDRISGGAAGAEMVDINEIKKQAYNDTKELLKSSIEDIKIGDRPKGVSNPMKLIYDDMISKGKTKEEIQSYFESELKDMEKTPYKKTPTALIDLIK